MVQKVFLLSVGTTSITYRARPAYIPVVPGDQVKFVNRTGQTVQLTFPAGLFAKPLTSIDNTGAEALIVQDVADGRYPYQGVVNGAPVEGESSPEIIVDR
jgi:hypothetical protein